MKKKLVSLLTLIFALYTLHLSAPLAHAICPVCTVAVGLGLGLSRYIGIDDTVSGVWVGGLILSSSFWLADFIHKKGVKIKIRVLNFASAALFYLITLVPLYFSGIIGHPDNVIYGIDKLIFGATLGSIVFLLGMRLDALIRQVNGKQLFVYQKVVFPVAALTIMSLIFYFVTKI